MDTREPAKPRRTPARKHGLSGDQETALLAIEMALSETRGHADDMSQWRLAQIERALAALDRGDHRVAMKFVERARLPPERVSERERAEAARLEKRLEVETLMARLAARRQQR